MVRILSLDFLGTKRLRGSTSGLGANGIGTDAQDSSRDRLKDVASEDKPLADGVVEMRWMEGIGGLAWGGVAIELESNGNELRIFHKIRNIENIANQKLGPLWKSVNCDKKSGNEIVSGRWL